MLDASRQRRPVNAFALCVQMSGSEPYDPSWLVELAREQVPEESWLPDALAACRRAWKESDLYTYFVTPHKQNLPGGDWQFDYNIVLEHPTKGSLVLDILKDGRIGGVETIPDSAPEDA